MLKRILLCCIGFALLPCLLLASGGKEKELLIPSEAGWVLGMDVKAILASETGNRLIYDTLASALPKDETLDILLADKLGIKLEDILTIQVFGIEEAVGAIIRLQMPPDAMLKKLANENPPQSVTYKKTTYLQFKSGSSAFNIYPLENRFLFSQDTVIMEKMLNVVLNTDDISKNKKLNQLVNQYRQENLYYTGSLPAAALDEAPEAFTDIRELGLSMRFSDSLAFKADLHCSTPDNAQNMAGFLKVSLSMAAQSLPKSAAAVKIIINQLLKPLKINAGGTIVSIELTYSLADLEAIKKLLPLFSKDLDRLMQ